MSTREELYAGVDGGATKTLAVVVNAAGEERGRSAAGSGNYQAVGLAHAIENVFAALHGALTAAGSSPTNPPLSAWIGLAGVDRTADVTLLMERLEGLAASVHLTNDAELALAALPGARGVAVIAGTGSIALGRDARGGRSRSGGWGHVVGDEGSGWDLGRLALRAIARASDGRGESTTLADAVLAHWGLDRPSDIIGRVYPDTDKAMVAALAGLVLSEAREGDAVARGLVDAAIDELTLLIGAAARPLHFADGGTPLALAGGLLVNETDFRERVLERVRREIAVGEIAVVRDAALSAARAARELPHPDKYD